MTIRRILRRLLGRGSGTGRERRIDVPVERESDTEPAPAGTDVSPSPAAADEPSGAEATETGSDEPVETIDGIGPAYAERLSAAGVETVGDLAAADPADLAERTGLGAGRIADWIERARAA